MSEPRPDESTGTADLRSHERTREAGAIRLALTAEELTGRIDNLSAGGVMFVSDGSIRISIEIEKDGERTVRQGRLVRVQRMNAEETAYAVEFED